MFLNGWKLLPVMKDFLKFSSVALLSLLQISWFSQMRISSGSFPTTCSILAAWSVFHSVFILPVMMRSTCFCWCDLAVVIHEVDPYSRCGRAVPGICRGIGGIFWLDLPFSGQFLHDVKAFFRALPMLTSMSLVKCCSRVCLEVFLRKWSVFQGHFARLYQDGQW